MFPDIRKTETTKTVFSEAMRFLIGALYSQDPYLFLFCFFKVDCMSVIFNGTLSHLVQNKKYQVLSRILFFALISKV